MLKTLRLCFSLISRQTLLATYRHFYLWSPSGNFILHMPAVLSQLSQCKMKPACAKIPLHSPHTLGRRQLNTTQSGVHSCTDQYCHSFSLFPTFPHPSACLRNGIFWQMNWFLFLLWARSGVTKLQWELSHTAGDEHQPREAERDSPPAPALSQEPCKARVALQLRCPTQGCKWCRSRAKGWISDTWRIPNINKTNCINQIFSFWNASCSKCKNLNNYPWDKYHKVYLYFPLGFILCSLIYTTFSFLKTLYEPHALSVYFYGIAVGVGWSCICIQGRTQVTAIMPNLLEHWVFKSDYYNVYSSHNPQIAW